METCSGLSGAFTGASSGCVESNTVGAVTYRLIRIWYVTRIGWYTIMTTDDKITSTTTCRQYFKSYLTDFEAFNLFDAQSHYILHIYWPNTILVIKYARKPEVYPPICKIMRHTCINKIIRRFKKMRFVREVCASGSYHFPAPSQTDLQLIANIPNCELRRSMRKNFENPI
jgi:hypothetical protein